MIILTLEESALSAWPALQTIYYDGWLLRFSNGYTKRANSINALYPSQLTVQDKIKKCEHLYQSKHLNTIFRMSPISRPTGLDVTLDDHGDAQFDHTLVQTLILDRTDHDATYPLSSLYIDTWLQAYCRLSRVKYNDHLTHAQILKSIPSPCIYGAIYYGGEIVSCGLGVLERQYIGLFDLVTEPDIRSQGFGTNMVTEILNWGKQHGARCAYLQMEPDGILDWDSRSISDIIAYFERSDTRVQPDTKRLIDYLEGKKIPLTDQEKDTIRRFHRNFINAGLNLKFTSHNRGPLSEYPSYRDLILEKDRSGQQVNYLVSESSYDYVRDLQERDRIIPVVGNLAGDQAIKSISTFLNAENIEVSAFYTSNVEFYLAGQNNISGFIDNLKSLPIKDNGVIIRSYFNRWSNHPLSVQGYASTQMIQRMFRLIEGHEEGNLIRYNQMVEDFEPLK